MLSAEFDEFGDSERGRCCFGTGLSANTPKSTHAEQLWIRLVRRVLGLKPRIRRGLNTSYNKKQEHLVEQAVHIPTV